MKKTEAQLGVGTLHQLVGRFDALKDDILAEMNRLYPKGRSVRFFRSDNQVNPSFGVIVCNWCMSHPEVRVRYEGSGHVVSLYPGLTRFSVMPNPSRQDQAARKEP